MNKWKTLGSLLRVKILFVGLYFSSSISFLVILGMFQHVIKLVELWNSFYSFIFGQAPFVPNNWKFIPLKKSVNFLVK